MNLFTVLSQGRGRLNEDNLSAMLGYLLAPSQTHGLGDSFLRPFLHSLGEACDDPARFAAVLRTPAEIRAVVFLESPYQVGNRRRVVDIEVRIFARADGTQPGEIQDVELHRIAIENKIKVQAADTEQLREEFLGIVQDLEGDDTVPVTMVFLTPPGDARPLVAEHAALDAATLGRHRKAWLRWAGAEADAAPVSTQLRRLLRQEADAEIAPFSDYLRHSLKAFIRHIEEGPAGSVGRAILPRDSHEVGDLLEVVPVRLGDTVYHLERYESTSIRVLNTASQEYEPAKPVFRRINADLALGVDLLNGRGEYKNTRTLGRDILRQVLEQGKRYGGSLLESDPTL